jgi:hypothetical protein
MVTPFSFYNMIDVFKEPGCVICNMLESAMEEFVSSLLYEYANDIAIQEKFQSGRGLCNEHSWQMLEYRGGGVLGIAVLYSIALIDILRTIKKTSLTSGSPSLMTRIRGGNTDAGANLADQLEPTERCLACETLIKAEGHYAETIIQHIHDPRLQEAYRASEGLCLPHFRLILRQTRDAESLQQFVTIQTAIWEHLYNNLEKFKDNYDVVKAEEMGEEGDSYQRAIAQMAGEPRIFGLNPRPKK